MRRQSLIWFSVVVVVSALGYGASTLAQDRVKVEVSVPAVPNLGTIATTPAPSELSVAPRGVVFVGSRGAYHVVGGGRAGHALYRDANNQFWSNDLTYYGMSNGYWIASVNGAPDTFLAFQATPSGSDAPFFKVLIHTPRTVGYVAWDEATRGNAE